MDLPPSGWYPDPYGTPSLLRWWDGSGWTQHTHPDVTAGALGASGVPAATTVLGAAVEATALQGTAIQDAVQATSVQPPVRPTALQATALQATTVQAATGQPSAEQLSRTKPPSGPPTQPQPALPVSPGAPAATAYQATAAVSGPYQPTTVQPGYPQPAMAWGPPAGADGAGTQVLAYGAEPWQAPGGPGVPGVPGGPLPGNPYGYQDAQRRRRRRLIGGLTAGTVAAVTAIAIIVSSHGSSPSTPVADQSPTVPPPSPSAAAPSATVAASASPSASASASPAATTGGLVTDGQSGLSYDQLPSPWQSTASCPSTLNNGAFPWTDGEYAPAGQVNGNAGPVTWYGEACSGPLPQQYYNYTGTADLQTVADSLASTFANAYYNALNHNIAPEQNTPIQVSGHAAWEATYDVSYTSAAAQGATWTDEQAAVVVVDNGTPTPSVFFVSIPSTLNEGYIASLVSSLQLNASSGSQPSNGASAGGSQGGGGNGNGGGGNGGGGNGGSNP